MKYEVSHRTTYSYDEDVTDSLGIAYLSPRELPWQRILERELVIEPVAIDRTEDLDYYGNVATYFQVTAAHQTLDILATSRVEVDTPTYGDAALATPWETAIPTVRDDVEDAWRAQDFALPSTLADHTPEVRAYAAESLLAGRPIGEAVTDLMHRIYADFRYDKTATTVTSRSRTSSRSVPGCARTSRT